MAYAFTANNPLSANNSFSSFPTGSYIGSFANPLTNPSLLFLMFFLASGITVTDLTDGAGRTWNLVKGSSDGTWQGWGAWAYNNTTGNPYIVVNFTGGPSEIGAVAQKGELIGAPSSSPLAAYLGNYGASSAPSLSLTDLSSGSCIVAATVNADSEDPTVGAGYTIGSSGNNGTYGYGSEYNLSSGTGSATVNFGPSVSLWNEMALAFKPAGSSGPPPSQFFLGADVLPFAPLSWVIRRRQQRARERSRSWRRQSGIVGLE